MEAVSNDAASLVSGRALAIATETSAVCSMGMSLPESPIPNHPPVNPNYSLNREHAKPLLASLHVIEMFVGRAATDCNAWEAC